MDQYVDTLRGGMYFPILLNIAAALMRACDEEQGEKILWAADNEQIVDDDLIEELMRWVKDIVERT